MVIIDISPDGTIHETVFPDPEPVTGARTTAIDKLIQLGLTPEEIEALIGGLA